MPICLKRHPIYPPRPVKAPEPRHDNPHRNTQAWSDIDDSTLLKFYGVLEIEELAHRLRRSPAAIRERVRKLRTVAS